MKRPTLGIHMAACFRTCLFSLASCLPLLVLTSCGPSLPDDPLFQRLFTGSDRASLHELAGTDEDFASALQGKKPAVSRVLQSAVIHGPDLYERRRAASSKMMAIMFRLGDDRFSSLLAAEDKQTREAVGEAMDWVFASSQPPFPKTRACYEYRLFFPPEQN